MKNNPLHLITIGLTTLIALSGCTFNAVPPPHCAIDAPRARINPEPPKTEPVLQPVNTIKREGS